MRKMRIAEYSSLDGVIQPEWPNEDQSPTTPKEAP
jgi:hypothetical protein